MLVNTSKTTSFSSNTNRRFGWLAIILVLLALTTAVSAGGSSEYDKYHGKACRTSHGHKGRDGHEYDKYKHYSLDKCKRKCSDEDWCTGYEWKHTKHSNHCEIWKDYIDEHELEYKHGFDCYIKRADNWVLLEEASEERAGLRGPNRELLLGRSCSPKNVNGLPHSFSGVHRCDDEDEWEREAQIRCIVAAQTQYGTMTVITFQTGKSPDYHVIWTEPSNGKCQATFDKLNCPMQVCI